MNSNASSSGAEAVALARFSLVSKIQELLSQHVRLKKVALETVASSSPRPDGQGASRPLQLRALEDWWYAYQHGGFAALHPKGRSDRGVPRRARTRSRNGSSSSSGGDGPGHSHRGALSAVEAAGPTLPALSAIYRALQRHDLNQRSRHYLMRQAIGGPTKAFEAPLVIELWMVDFPPGPFLHLAGQKKATATHLCAILNNHSRVLPHAAFYLRADTRCFHCSFKEAIRRRGVPSSSAPTRGARSLTTTRGSSAPTWASACSTPSLITPGAKAEVRALLPYGAHRL